MMHSCLPAETARSREIKSSDETLFANEPDIMDVNMTAALLHVDPKTIRREIARGKLRCVHVGSCVRIKKTDLVLYLSCPNAA